MSTEETPPAHQPVLYQEVLEAIHPLPGGSYLDGTVGLGGHARGILEASAPNGHLLGLDVDPQALELAGQRLVGGETGIGAQGSPRSLARW